METEDRSERVAIVLEEQLQRCQSALADCFGHINRKGHWGEWELRNVLGLMKMSAQLGGVIGRLSAKAPGRKAEPPKNHGSDGLIPQ